MYEQIIEMLKKQKGKFRQISNETGLDYDWLHQVSRGVITDPGIKKMETLHAHLQKIEKNTATA